MSAGRRSSGQTRAPGAGGPGGSVDHIVPRALSRPGLRRNWMNLTGACYECNARRGDAPVLAYLADPKKARRAARTLRRANHLRRQSRAKLLRRLKGLLIGRAWRLHRAENSGAPQTSGCQPGPGPLDQTTKPRRRP